MVMIIVALVVFGVCLGSFANALVWRVHQQAEEIEKKQPDGARLKDLSITQGRSMCPHCNHELAAKDLIPVLSWLSLAGKCRYCRKKISIQYPIVEISTALFFVGSYVWWPEPLIGIEILAFGLWLTILTGLMALLVYDLKWYLLPNRIVYPLAVLAGLLAVVETVTADNPLRAVISTALAVIIGGGIFYVLFQVSGGKWIGGGDVKLGWLLGLILATPANSFLMIFIAALLGSIVSVPLLLDKKLKRTSVIPFGPFLIIAAVLVQLFGTSLVNWYQHTLLMI